MTERRGRFITFEGPDGSGKSTQMTLVASRLRDEDKEVVETQEPGGTAVGRQIRNILLDAANDKLCPVAEMLLYFAARAQNFDEVIEPAWQRGAIVLSDRFTDSTLAYQGGGRGLGENVVLGLHDLACHGLQPDLTVCIDIDPDIGLARVRARNQGRGDRMDEQEIEFHRRVRDAYLRLAGQHPERIVVVEGSGSVAEVAERVWQVVEPVVRGV
jgi:dTMP kinase